MREVWLLKWSKIWHTGHRNNDVGKLDLILFCPIKSLCVNEGMHNSLIEKPLQKT